MFALSDEDEIDLRIVSPDFFPKYKKYDWDNSVVFNCYYFQEEINSINTYADVTDEIYLIAVAMQGIFYRRTFLFQKLIKKVNKKQQIIPVLSFLACCNLSTDDLEYLRVRVLTPKG